MPSFSVNPHSLHSIANEESKIAKDLDRINNQLNTLMKSIPMNTSQVEQIKKELRTVSNSVTTRKGQISALANALDDIASIYEKTERNLCGIKGLRSGFIKEELAKIASGIASAASKLGTIGLMRFSKDPVNLSNGNYVYEKKYLALNGIVDFDFSVFYNVLSDDVGVLGKGWMHSGEMRLEKKSDRVEIVRFNGRREVFVKKEDIYLRAVGSVGQLSTSAGSFVYTDSDTDSYEFNELGQLIKKKNLAGMYCTYEYEDNRLTKIADDKGDSLSFSYEDNKLALVEDHSGRKVSFEYENNSPVRVIDALGFSTQYVYDAEGRLCEIINNKGIRSLKNEYDSMGRTVHQVFPDGGEVAYTYYDSDLSVEMTEQNGNVIKYYHDELLRNVKTVYSDGEESSVYDEDNNRISFTDKRGNSFKFEYAPFGKVSKVTNPLGDYLEYEYTDSNQITKYSLNGDTLQSFSYNENNLLEETVDAFGAKEAYKYDDKNQLVEHWAPDGSHISLKYDSKGNISEMINPLGGVTRYEYNDRHQVSKTIDPFGNTECFEYDAEDRIVASINANGDTKHFKYDPCGNLIEVVDYNGAKTVATYNEINKLESYTDPDGNTTTYEYDKMWNISKITNAEGGVSLFEYDANSNLIKATDTRGYSQRMEYDPNGNLVKRVNQEGNTWILGYDPLDRPDHIKDDNGSEYWAKYDAMGNVTEVRYADGTTLTYTYDVLGRITSSVDAQGYTKYYKYDMMGNMEEIWDDQSWLSRFEFYPGGLMKHEMTIDGKESFYEYNENEKIVKITDESGGVTLIDYDCYGNIARISKGTGESETYTYDGVGNITSVTDGEGNTTDFDYSKTGLLTAVTDAVGNRTEYTYDKLQRLVKIYNGEDRITEYKRDPQGNILSITTPDKKSVQMTYDGCNRLIKKVLQDLSEQNISYYPDGQIKQMSFGDGKTVKYSYDALKRLIEMQDWIGKTSIERDANGRITKVVEPNGDVFGYEWNQRGDREKIEYPNGDALTYSYDDTTHLTKLCFGDNSIDYSYNVSGKLASKNYSNGANISYKYNSNGLIEETLYSYRDEVLEKNQYSYDKNGRKASLTRNKNMQTNKFEYAYSSVGNLISVINNGISEEQYVYDRWGNRTESLIRGERKTYSYDNMDHLLSVQDSSGSERTYEYDLCGHLNSEKLNGQDIRKTVFNSIGLLSEVIYKENHIKYEYNGMGYRSLEKVTNFEGASISESRYLYDISKDYNNLLSVSENNSFSNVFWDDEFIGTNGTQGMSFSINDDMMNPRYLFNGDSFESVGDFDSFGNMIAATGSTATLLGFVGYRQNKFTDLLYVNAREYDPTIGRFISRDFIEGDKKDPLTQNKYAYCNSDPVNYWDPLGLFKLSLACVVGGIKAAANVVTKLAGDIVDTAVESVKNGKFTPTFSPWEEYVGTAVGGFTEGFTYVAFPGTKEAKEIAAEAAGSSAETFTTNGLKMLTGREGYRKEDGYTLGNLLSDTVVSGAKIVTDAIMDKAKGKIFKDPKIKIEGITKGTGSWLHVGHTQITKIGNGTTKNIKLKTAEKIFGVFVGVNFVDELWSRSKKAGKDLIEEKGKELIKSTANNLFDHIFGNNSVSGTCPLEAAG